MNSLHLERIAWACVALAAVRAALAASGQEWSLLGVLAFLLVGGLVIGQASRLAAGLVIGSSAVIGLVLAGALLRAPHGARWSALAAVGLALLWLVYQRRHVRLDWPGSADAAVVCTVLLTALMVAFDLAMAQRTQVHRTIADWSPVLWQYGMGVLLYGSLSRALWPFCRPRTRDSLLELVGIPRDPPA